MQSLLFITGQMRFSASAFWLSVTPLAKAPLLFHEAPHTHSEIHTGRPVELVQFLMVLKLLSGQ